MAKIIVAHRGGNEYFHENTLKAYKKAIDLGTKYFELDIRKTKDNKIVCFHNSEIQNQKISNITYKELLNLSGIEVPLFEDALKLTKGKINMLCEIKAVGYEKEALALIKKHFDDGIIVVSFFDKVLYKIHKLDPTMKTGLIFGKKNLLNILMSPLVFFRIFKCKTNYLMLNFHYIKMGFAKIAHFLKIKVFTWTIDTPEEIVKYIKNDDVYGIITNKPQMALELLAACSDGK